jgi:hypothetical protein
MALDVFGALNITDSWIWSIYPLFQLILGCIAVNHGYPRIALCSPNSVRKNLICMFYNLVCTARSV